MSDKTIEELIVVQKGFREYMKEKGYQFDDPFQTLLFLSTTHLPYIRITQRGLYDVKKENGTLSDYNALKCESIVEK